MKAVTWGVDTIRSHAALSRNPFSSIDIKATVTFKVQTEIHIGSISTWKTRPKEENYINATTICHWLDLVTRRASLAAPAHETSSNSTTPSRTMGRSTNPSAKSRRKYSEDTLLQVVHEYQVNGKNCADISRKLDVSETTVRRTIKNWEETGKVKKEKAEKNGRPAMISGEAHDVSTSQNAIYGED
jgi:transposase-like protein